MKWVTDELGFNPAAVNIGVIKGKQEIFLVDTGIDNSAVNKVIKQLDTTVTGAFVTHHHADHMGGGEKLHSLGVTIYAPDMEIPIITNSILEPYTMFGGAYPPTILQSRHLKAKSIPNIETIDKVNFGTPIKCPGHTMDHHALFVDDVLYASDAAFSSVTIEKYNLLFAVNPQLAAKSTDTLKSLDPSVIIPGHGAMVDGKRNCNDMLETTRNHYTDTSQQILNIIGEKLEYERYLSTAIDELQLQPIIQERGFLQYILYQVPLFGYLSNLIDEKLVYIDTSGSKVMIIAQ